MTFSQHDPGTPEQTWIRALQQNELPALAPGIGALLVVAAHPDDETLGVGGFVHQAARRGLDIVVLALTDGEGSHPDSPTHSRAELAARRRIELGDSIRELAPDAQVVFVGLPDGSLRDHVDDLTVELAARARALRARHGHVLVLAPWTGDGHGDHRVAGEAAVRACAVEGVPLRMYPIWLWHWGSPHDVPWADAEAVRLAPADVAAKTRALAHHASQTAPLSDAPGDEVMLHAAMQAHFLRETEVVFRPAVPAGGAQGATGSLDEPWFEAFYARNADPWGFDSRWYEERKRAILMASLPERRSGRGVELGCSTGALTAALATRVDELLAVDITDAALARATERLGGASGVTFVKAALPAEWPQGRFDLVVLSEIGYYWGRSDLELAVRRIEQSLASDGVLVACHWRHRVAEYPLTGDDVHDVLRSRSGLTAIARHEEADFVLDVFVRPPARSVAQREGLIP